jgi:N-acetylglutamate synthase-like GNAT family acetyltransferase
VTRTGSIVRPATPEDFPFIAELLDRTLGKRPYGERLKLWNWRFNRNPARTDAFPSFLVAEEKGRIIGVHGLIPLRVKSGKRQLNASCSCDLAADPAARSAGMKLKLAALAKEISPLHFSTSANEPANKITLALGGKEVFSGRRKYIKPLKASGLLRRRLTGKGTPEGIATAASLAIGIPADWALAIDRMARPPGKTTGTVVRNVASFDGRYDEFWEGMSEDHMILVVRDSSYLNWRYSEYPFPGIRSFELSRGEHLLGYSVIHLGIDEDRLRFAALLELAGRKMESGVLEHLLREAIRCAADAGAHYLIARASTPESEALFQDHGYIRREMNYSPVTYKNNSDVPHEVFANDGNWYLSLGDGDGCYYYDICRVTPWNG